VSRGDVGCATEAVQADHGDAATSQPARHVPRSCPRWFC
jgi:hypothetical protein